jgi:hypothetical protein
VIRRLVLLLLTLTTLLVAGAPSVQAAGADMYLSGGGTITVGQTVTVTLSVNTNGQSANSFDSEISFPAGLFTPVRGSTSGSICNLYVSQPDPTSGNPTEDECGKSNGFTGTGSLGAIVLTASTPGSGSFGLSGCQVLANDGKGTDITGGCSGTGVTVVAAATAAPAAAATPKPTAKPAATPTPKAVALNQTPKPAETPNTPAATATPTPPPIQSLPSAAPTAATAKTVATAAPGATPAAEQRRTVGTAISNLFSSLGHFSLLPKDPTGAIALFIFLIPLLAILLAILYLFYRIYLLGKKRQRTMDHLFEMELQELAALEGKMDLLAEKGLKGREEYKEEFEKAKANILRQLRPDYGKPADPPSTV